MELAEFTQQRRTVRTSSGEVGYTEFGTGRPVLFVHGLGTNGCFWRNLVGLLRDGYRCIAVDLPGHGASPVSTGRDHTLHGLADSLADFCEAMNLHAVDLVANDTGGAIAQIFAVHHPRRLATLTLTNCEAHDNLPNEVFRPTVERARRGELAPMAAQLMANHAAVRSEQSLGGSYNDPTHLTDELIRSYFEPVVGTPEAAAAFERLISSMGPNDLLGVERGLRTLETPTLIVWGTDDKHFELSWARWLRDTIPGAYSVVEIEGGRLHFPDERAGELAPLLREHWATHPLKATAATERT